VCTCGEQPPSAADRQVQKWWSPSLPGSLKINVDGAFIPSSGVAAVGVVIRDHVGQEKLASWRVLSYCRDAEEAEAAACREGITLAARWSETHMVLETDCVVVAANLKNTDQDRLVGWCRCFEPPTSKFVFAHLARMVCSEDTRDYTSSAECPYAR
jgi:ribonuclease HI